MEACCCLSIAPAKTSKQIFHVALFVILSINKVSTQISVYLEYRKQIPKLCGYTAIDLELMITI